MQAISTESAKQTIESLLIELNLSPHYKGYHYCLSALLLCLEDIHYLSGQITKTLYENRCPIQCQCRGSGSRYPPRRRRHLDGGQRRRVGSGFWPAPLLPPFQRAVSRPANQSVAPPFYTEILNHL